MIVSPPMLFFFSLVLIQFPGVLQSNTLLLVLPLRPSIVRLQLSLLLDILIPVQLLPTLFLDNLDASYLSTNPVFHYLMKHFVIDYHFVRDLVQSFELCVVHVSAGD